MKKLSLVLGAAAIAALLFFSRELRWELAYQTSPPPAPRASHRLPRCAGCNLMVISLDTLRADHAAAVPNLREIASGAVEFTAAYTNSFYTTPAHMTLFTSLYPNRHRVSGAGVQLPRWPRTAETSEALSPRYRTLAELARDQGYRTRWFAPLNLKHLDPALGFGRGFERFSPPLFGREGANGRFDASTWIAALKNRGPFFYFVHSYVTHLPFFLPDSNAALFSKSQLIDNYFERSGRASRLPAQCASKLQLPGCLGHATLADIFLHDLGQFQLWSLEHMIGGRETARASRQARALSKAYSESVRRLDHQVGELWQAFKASGRAGDTLVVLLSDHGEELFEHGHGSHSSFYQHTARVPLVLFHPRLQTPLQVNEPVSLIDILPTLTSILEWPPLPQAQGRDLTVPREPEPVFGFALGNDFVTDGRWKLIRGPQGLEEIYFLPGDPGEKHNLAGLRWPRIHRAAAQLREARRQWELEQAL